MIAEGFAYGLVADWQSDGLRRSGALVELARPSGGRALVLFTSHSALRTVYALAAGPLQTDGIRVLAQGIDGSPRQLVRALKADPATVLLGTASFWEGVDVVGAALSVLVIARLPFSVPDDPIFAARSETFDNPFAEYAIPETILRFRQGFGRLIRHKDDRGVVVIMDRRIVSKFYGQAFLDALPQCTVVQRPLADLPRLAAEWLEAG